jgi:hypothetical protein
MKLSLLAGILLLSGCTAIPTVPAFPKPPTSLDVPARLKPIAADTTELSILLDNAAENYGTYYELKVKYEAWLEWYTKQKKIFEEIK